MALLALVAVACTPTPTGDGDGGNAKSSIVDPRWTACVADADHGGTIDVGDISVLASQLGRTCAAVEAEDSMQCIDLDRSGTVNLADISQFSTIRAFSPFGDATEALEYCTQFVWPLVDPSWDDTPHEDGPSVESAPSQWGEGDVARIEGIGFGVKDAAPYLFDDFDSGALGGIVEATAQAPWNIEPFCGTYGPTYSDLAPRYSGGRAARQQYRDTSDCGYVYNQDLLIAGVPSTRIYFQGWFWSDTDEPERVRNIKPWQFSSPGWQYPQSRFEAQGINEALIMTVHDVDSNRDGYSEYSHTDWGDYSTLAFGEGRWRRLEVLHDDGTAGREDGVFQVFIDGEQVFSYEGLMKSADDPARTDVHVWGYIGICGAYNDGSCGPDDGLYGGASPRVDVLWSDVYVDTSWARVQLGNAPVYEDATHREVQVPVLWTDDTIEVEVRPGSFAEGENVWLFVVDPSGVASAGYPVQIGAP